MGLVDKRIENPRAERKCAWRTETTTVTDLADAAERQRRLELKELLNKKYKWVDWKWDLVFWTTAVFVVAGAADITKQLFAGDWDFWTDWKDPQWWPVVTAFATIIIPSTLQYIQWTAWRFSDRCDLHRVLLIFCGLGWAVFPVGPRSDLPHEFRVACLRCLRRHLDGLDLDEDQEFYPHLADRCPRVGDCGLGL